MLDHNERIHFSATRTFGGPEGATVPQELLDIQQEWAELANGYGDVGSCVLGAGFEFTYNGQPYFMRPTSRWQGSCSWEAFKDQIHQRLEEIGATDIRYNWGNLD